jgi:pimeloyl-ACP methyl ester carboxylesterase
MDHVELITLADGRALEVATVGDDTKPTVVFHHGTPGSWRTVTLLQPLIDSGDFFFVATSRAGYGRSSRDAGRNFASVVGDTRAALDHLGRDRYTTLGWSGGGPHALACAALDAPRCRGVVAIASVVPIDVDIDWTDGMGPENLEEFEMARQGGAAFEAAIEASGAFLAQSTSENLLELMGGLLSDPDAAVLGDDNLRAAFAESTAYGFVEGWRGFYDDDVAIFTPWGFDPASIAVPAHLFYGDQDRMVPPTHGHWLSTHLATSTTHHYPNDGHLSIFANHVDEVAAAITAATD